LEAGQRGQVAAEPLGEAQVFGGIGRVGKGSTGDQEPSPFETSAILYENALADVMISQMDAKRSSVPQVLPDMDLKSQNGIELTNLGGVLLTQ